MHDDSEMRDFAERYAKAWCSGDPDAVAAYYVPRGTISVNGGEPTEIAEVARSFKTAFPDMQVFMDDLRVDGDAVEFHWTFTGTNNGPDGTGKSVRISGFETWTMDDSGLVASSRGTFDEAEYARQLAEGV